VVAQIQKMEIRREERRAKQTLYKQYMLEKEAENLTLGKIVDIDF